MVQSSDCLIQIQNLTTNYLDSRIFCFSGLYILNQETYRIFVNRSH